ncbi:hypothetical protein E2C01_024197 [Portunus trituberculatus]|uniref:Uncharacterized protein n=1 Tax=Portunus trituberculatus TaxID=210409 RepID=A0A5B7EC32_PORTR|nr:hypothetical protein [Portunus trituberculatus]
MGGSGGVVEEVYLSKCIPGILMIGYVVLRDGGAWDDLCSSRLRRGEGSELVLRIEFRQQAAGSPECPGERERDR